MTRKNASSLSVIILGFLAFIIPLTFIAIAIIKAPWFSILNNALSDLGHARKSNVAPLFNLGLSLGGFLIGSVSTYFISKISKVLSIVLSFTGYSLILVAVFDEIYGYLHFIVSVSFFMSLAASLIAYAIVKRTILPIPLLIIGILAWIIHYSYNIPRGVAIPELISVFAVLPFYANLIMEAAKT